MLGENRNWRGRVWKDRREGKEEERLRRGRCICLRSRPTKPLVQYSMSHKASELSSNDGSQHY
jgi:hypothetical protein